MFLDFALFPHLTAAENVAFGLDDWDEEACEAHVDELLELVGLTDHADSKPNDSPAGNN